MTWKGFKMSNKKLSAEDYLQGFHNAHMYMNEATGTPEWYDLAASGMPMNGIPLESQMFNRGGSVALTKKST